MLCLVIRYPLNRCAVKNRMIYDSLLLVCTIIEKVNRVVTLINLNQSQIFNSVDHCFLEAVLSAARFKSYIHSGMHIRCVG